MAKIPTVTITGGDELLIALSGQFKKGLEERLLGVNSLFLKELDKASVKVFRSMANGSITHGFRANPVMGTHQKTPFFLFDEGANWEPLQKDYFKRKKRLMANHSGANKKPEKLSKDKDVGSVRTTAFWEYKGELRRFFTRQSANLTRISNNAVLANATATPVGSDLMFTDVIKRQNASLRITGGFKNSKPDSFDFSYSPQSNGRSISAVRKTGAKKGQLVRSQDISRMMLNVEYDLFRGLKMHVDAMLGKGMAPSPEDYIAGIQFTTSKTPTRLQQYRNRRGRVTHYMNSKGDVIPVDKVSNNPLAHKLFYKRDGQLRQRQLIQPYMRYYVKRVLVPMSKALLSQGKI